MGFVKLVSDTTFGQSQILSYTRGTRSVENGGKQVYREVPVISWHLFLQKRISSYRAELLPLREVPVYYIRRSVYSWSNFPQFLIMGDNFNDFWLLSDKLNHLRKEKKKCFRLDPIDNGDRNNVTELSTLHVSRVSVHLKYKQEFKYYRFVWFGM